MEVNVHFANVEQAELEEEILSSDAKYQLDALRSVRRQLVEDILPDSQRSLQNWVAAGFPGFSPQDITNKALERLDDITSSGKLPPPPEPVEVVKSIIEESRNLFLSTPELETPNYKVCYSFSSHYIWIGCMGMMLIELVPSGRGCEEWIRDTRLSLLRSLP